MQVWLNLRMKKNVGEKTILTEKVRHLRSKDGSDTSTKFLYHIRIPHIIKKSFVTFCNIFPNVMWEKNSQYVFPHM